MIVGVENVKRGSVGANRAWVVELRLFGGPIFVALFAGASNRRGLHRGNIDPANYFVSGIGDVDGLLVDRDSARTIEHRFGHVAFGLARRSRLAGNRLDVD